MTGGEGSHYRCSRLDSTGAPDGGCILSSFSPFLTPSLEVEAILGRLRRSGAELEAGFGGSRRHGVVLLALGAGEILIDDLVGQFVNFLVLMVLKTLDLVQSVAFFDHVADHLGIEVGVWRG